MQLRKTLGIIASAAVMAIILLNCFPILRTKDDQVVPTKKAVVVSPNSIVCPEHYAGPTHKSETKWVTEDCDYAVPMPKLVTIILLDSDSKMASVVQHSLPGVPVIVKGSSKQKNSGSIKYVTAPKKSTTGEIWNSLINACDTPYAFLIANVLNVSLDLWTLQRLVRVLSETEGTKIVGGATRNGTGHWQAGCYQMTLKNYVLTYQKGYHQSVKECMRCDHVDAPFLVETKLLKKEPMDKKLPTKMLFPDFFIKVFRSQNSLLCPDVMVDANAHLGAMDRDTWKKLAVKRQLNRIYIRFPRSSILHKFNCSELGLRCKMKGSMTKTLPVCCQEEFARHVDFWAEFANQHGITYQFLSGSLLGAVKMEDMVPWDTDGDMFFDRGNFSFVASSIGTFKKAGINLKIMKKPSAGDDYKSWGYMQMLFSSFFIEMYAVPMNNPKAKERMIPDKAAPPEANSYNVTKVEIHGVWVNTASNPGLYARGRYGKEILKHAMSWRQTGKKSSYAPYDAGLLNVSCKGTGHHACLNTMPTDGSIFYNVPEY